jgi:hypothetical protein
MFVSFFVLPFIEGLFHGRQEYSFEFLADKEI